MTKHMTAYPAEVATAVLLYLVNNIDEVPRLGLEAEHFPTDDLARMYAWLSEVQVEGGRFESVTEMWDRAHAVGGPVYDSVQSWLDRIDGYGVPLFVDKTSAKTIESFARVLRRARARREVLAAQDAVDHIDPDDPAGAAVKMVELSRRIESWQREADGIEVRMARPSEIFRDTLDRPELTVSLGWPRMMGRMGGGLPRGDILTLMGCTSVGKTTWALQSVERFLIMHPHERCVIFSIEMPRRQLVTRQLMGYTGCTRAELESCVRGDGTWPNMHRTATDWDRQSTNLIIDEDCRTLPAMRSVLDNLGGATLVVIDYLQLMQRPGASKEYEAITNNMYDLKAFAKACDVAVLLLCQVPRSEVSGPDKPPSLRSGKGSGAIEDTSDFVIGLWRPSYKAETEREQDLVGVSAALLKSRHGFEGVVPFELDRPRQMVREM